MRLRILILWLVSNISYAQQDIQFSQYMFNRIAVNPASAGNRPDVSLSMFHRVQYFGLDEGIQIQSLTLNLPISQQRWGVAAIILNESQLGSNQFSFHAATSYKINFGQGKLTFGLKAGIEQFQFTPSALRIRHPLDPVLGSKSVSVLPDLGTGIEYFDDKQYVGLSVNHLMENDLSFTDSSSAVQTRHLYLTAGRKFGNGNIEWVPTTLIKRVSGVPILFEANMMVRYRKVVWLAGSFRTSSEFSLQTGFFLNKLYKKLNRKAILGYSFDFGSSELMKRGKGTHEIVLNYGFNLRSNAKKIERQKNVISPGLFY